MADKSSCLEETQERAEKDHDTTKEEELEEEVKRLRRIVRILGTRFPQWSDSSSSLPRDTAPIATVVYYNSSQEQFREQIERFVRSFKDEHKEISLDEEEEEETTYQHNALTLNNGTADGEDEASSLQISGLVQYHRDFILDWLGTPMISRGSEYCLPDSLRVVYTQVYRYPFWVSGYAERNNYRLRQMAKSCFNCGEYHHIKDCTEPINPFNVAKNRLQFLKDFGVYGSDKRYYLEDQERFQGFKPGIISSKLRAALGITDNDYPVYVLRMKHLGYPPGWRQFQLDILKMFDKEGQEIPCQLATEDIIYPGYNDNQEATTTQPALSPSSLNKSLLIAHQERDDPSNSRCVSKSENENVQRVTGDDFEASLPQKRKRSLDVPHEPLSEVSEPHGRWKNLVQIIGNKKRKL